MAEDILYDQEQQVSGGDPEPLRKLYDVVSQKGLYTKSFDDFKVKYSKPEEKDRLFNVVSQEGLYTKGKDEFSKKYFGGITSEPTKDLLTLSKERKAIKEAQVSGQGYGYGGAPVAQDVIDSRKKELENVNQKIKDAGGDESFANDIEDLPQGEGFSFVRDIPALLKMRQENPNAYYREISADKAKGNLYNAIRDKSDVQTANNVIQGLQQTEKQDYRSGTKEGISLIRKYVDDADQQQRMIKDFVSNKAYDYGIQPTQNDDRFANLNPYQQKAMQFLEDVDPATFQSYQRLMSVNPDEQWMGSKEGDIRRGYEMKGKELENIGMGLEKKAYEEKLTNYNNKAAVAQMTDDEKSIYEQEQSKMQQYDKEIENRTPKGDEKIEYNDLLNKLKELDQVAKNRKLAGYEIARYNRWTERMDEITIGSLSDVYNKRNESVNKINSIVDKYKGKGLSPEEKIDYEQTFNKYQTLSKDKEDQNNRYPTQAIVDSDQLMQEALGNKNSVVKKFALGVGENFDDAVNWVGDLFQNEGVAGDLELLGDKQSSGLNRYTSESGKLIGSDFVAKFSPELQKQIDDIKNSKKSDEQKQDQVRSLILNNQNEVSYVANDKAGKSNFTAKAVMNTVGDVASDLVSQLAIAYVSGGAGATTKLGELTSLFGSTFATAYNDYYNEALQKNIPNPTQYAITHTSIEAASELINNDFEVARKIAGKSGTLGKVLNAVTKEQWDTYVKKGMFAKFKNAALQTGKTALENSLQEAKEEVAGQLAGNIADQQLFNRETGIGEGVKDTFIQTMVGMLPLGLISLPFNYHNINRTQKYAMYEAGMNPEKYRNAIDAQLQAGNITQQEANERKLNVDAAARAVKSSQSLRIDGVPMTDNEKTDYAFNQAVIQEIKEQKKDAPPEVKEKLEKEEEKLNQEQTELLKPKKQKQTEDQKIVNSGIKSGKIVGVIAEQAKTDPNAFLKMIADQAFGRTDTGEMSAEPNAEYAVREQYGDKIVDKAKELYPLKVQEPSREQQLKEINEGNTATFTYNKESEVPEIFKDKISSIGEINGKPFVKVTMAKSLSDYYLSQQKNKQDAGSIRKNKRQIQEGGNATEGSQNQSGENIQPSEIKAPVNGEIKQQAGGEEITINTPEDFERELTKVFATEKQPEVQPEATPQTTEKTKAAPKPKKEKPVLNKKQQEQADYAYNNSYRFFKQKYPDIDVEEYNRLRSQKRQQGLPKLGEINQQNNTRPQNEDTTQYTPKSVIEKAKSFYKNDPLINRVISFLDPIIKANPNIKIDTSFKWDAPQYEGQKITNQALGYSFPSGNLILNFDRISDYDTLYRTALHELMHAATRNEINTNSAFNEDLKKVLGDVRKAMGLPEGDSVVDALIRNKVISEDYDSRYGAANEHELLAEVFTNQKFFDYLKGLEYKGDNMLHRIFLAIAKFFSEKYKALVEAKSNINADNIADYLQQLTESVVSGEQQQAKEGNALPQMRQSEREVLKNVVAKALGKISEADIRSKLKQIANLTDQEIDDLLAEVQPPTPKAPPAKVLTQSEIGNTPSEPKRKSKLRRFGEKYFTRSKGLPDWILALKDRSRGEVHLEVRQALNLVDEVKKTAKRLGFDNWELFDKALRGQYYGSDLADLKALPPEMQVLNVQMRNKIDSLSRDLIINNYVTPEQALNIESNIGEYMTRSYRAFNEKNWGKKVPQQARDDAFRFLTQEHFNNLMKEHEDELNNGTITEYELIEQARNSAHRELQSIVDGISDKYTPTKSNVEKGKDLGILKQRKDVPKEIRELLGEYTDPGVNFAMTIARIASLKSSAEYLTNLKQQGMGEIFFEGDSRPPEASVQIAPEGSETWNPLNGLYATPEVKEIFKESEHTRNWLVRTWLKTVGAIKWSKTVGSVVTQIKNFESNLGFSIMNGHYRAGKFGESYKFLKDKLISGETSKDQMIEKVIRLGLVDQSVGVRELRNMFEDDKLEKVIANSSISQTSALKKIGRVAGKGIDYLNKIYGASDDFWKVYGFMNEAESLSQATYNRSYKNLTEDEKTSIDTEASERIKNTYPTYDRVWEGAKYVSKNLPIFGNFLSFQAESIRVLLNTFDYAMKDMKVPERRTMAARRLAGVSAYLGARTAILYTIAQMTGVGMAGLLGAANDDDEDQKLKDINRYSPDFIRSGDKLAKDQGDGNYMVYDVGSLEPYGIWFKTMNAYTEGNDIVKGGGIGASAAELLSPFIEPEMSFKIGLNLYNNENDFGSRIYNPMDSFGDQMLDAMTFIMQKTKPSTIDFIQRVYKREDKGNEIAAAFGGRGYKVDVAKNFSFKLKAAEELFDANRDALNKIKYNPESSEEDINNAQKVFEERTNKIIKMLSEDYHAGIRLGVSLNKLDEAIDRKKFFQGYNKDVKNQIKSGVVEEEAPASEEIKEWQP